MLSGRCAPASRLTAELVVGGVCSALYGQMLDHPELTFTAVASSPVPSSLAPYATVDAPPARGALERATHRTTRVLCAIPEAPCSSNREIADAASLRDEAQAAKLLSRLEQRGLIENVGLGAAYGQANERLLTSGGGRVLAAVRRVAASEAGRPRRSTARGHKMKRSFSVRPRAWCAIALPRGQAGARLVSPQGDGPADVPLVVANGRCARGRPRGGLWRRSIHHREEGSSGSETRKDAGALPGRAAGDGRSVGAAGTG